MPLNLASKDARAILTVLAVDLVRCGANFVIRVSNFDIRAQRAFSLERR